MKNLLISFVTLLGSVSVWADADLQLICKAKDNQQQAVLTISAESQYRDYDSEECNGGVGDDFTNCHTVTYHLEDKTATVEYNSIISSFRVSRFVNSKHLFSGWAELFDLGEINNSYVIILNPSNSATLLYCAEQAK
ncbi:hypothetical protein CIK05_10520 [Bdellovibrio sp. qaytius]|nr:hypothetical protein CIK05_10520 [Bdellovibrio sp. qaytius]